MCLFIGTEVEIILWEERREFKNDSEDNEERMVNIAF